MRKNNRHRNRGYAVEEVEQLSDVEFRKMFRMTREGFSSLLEILAGGSYLDITFAFGVSKTAFFSGDPISGILWPTIAAINEAFFMG
eukprot:gene7850-gene8596